MACVFVYRWSLLLRRRGVTIRHQLIRKDSVISKVNHAFSLPLTSARWSGVRPRLQEAIESVPLGLIYSILQDPL
jgi:hypothetical protein